MINKPIDVLMEREGLTLGLIERLCGVSRKKANKIIIGIAGKNNVYMLTTWTNEDEEKCICLELVRAPCTLISTGRCRQNENKYIGIGLFGLLNLLMLRNDWTK